MQDNESQNLNGLNEKMDAVHLQVSQPSSGEQSSRDTGDKSTIDERPTLFNLAGELQNLIFKHLHPSAAARLRQTNRYFNSIVDIPISAVFDYLQEKEQLPTHSDDFACFTCLRLKCRSLFPSEQTKRSRGKNGERARKRFCVDCGVQAGKSVYGLILGGDKEYQLLCCRCETFQKRFCPFCSRCDSCFRKGNGYCRYHWWIGPEPAGGTSNFPDEFRQTG